MGCPMQTRWRWLVQAAALVLGGWASAAQAASAPASKPMLELPVREVTVFSDRARIVRRADAKLEPGTQSVRLPLLPSTIDPASVRLDATGARVLRVEVQRAVEGEFPRVEAEAMLRRLELLGDEQQALHDALDTWDAERRFLSALRPGAPPSADAMHPPMLLDPSGWKTSLGFLDQREVAVDAATAPLQQQLRDKQREIAEAVERARQLCAGDTGTPGFKVEAVIDGKGKGAELSLSYVAMGARWFPSYDVRYEPGDAKVEVSFSGLVSQETGEDWTDAKLVLSTAIPATTASLPKLSVWKIGDRERFIPTPVPEWEAPPRPPPPMPWATPQPKVGAMADDELREALDLAANSAEAGRQVTQEKADVARRQAMAPQRPGGGENDKRSAMPPQPPPAAAPASKSMQFSSMEVYGSINSAEAPEERPMAVSESTADRGFASSRERRPTQQVAFGAPLGWQAPSFAPDLPAVLAGGYDFVYPAAKPESVRSGAEARRVALHARKFPADGMIRVLPALRKQAYLVAEITNDGDKPLLKGQAHLFVGADLVGEAVVPTTSVGEKVTLPLGVDDAIRIERNVKVLSSQKGVFSKQDVSGYEVVIELMNPRPRSVRCVVVDQVPLKRGEDVEVTVDSGQPVSAQDKVNGLLEWRFDLAGGAKQVVKFQYSIVRPKDAKLTQSTAPTGSTP